jgi:hypothetical protein
MGTVEALAKACHDLQQQAFDLQVQRNSGGAARGSND